MKNMPKPKYVCVDSWGVPIVGQEDYDALRAHAQILERELAAAQSDAERYRWLRSECGRYIDWDELESIDGDISEVGFDAAIDAAMKEDGK